MSVGQPLQDIALVELAPGALGSTDHRLPENAQASSQKHCVLLRAGGLLSLLNMEEGIPFSIGFSMTKCFESAN